jgi:hypothetical protein
MANMQDEDPGRWLTKKDSENLLDLVLLLPHGVHKMSHAMKGLVETSSNLAAVDIDNGCYHVQFLACSVLLQISHLCHAWLPSLMFARDTP